MHLMGLAVLVTLALLQPAQAQSPYAGMQNRSIKALSDQQVADLEAGRGMGLAMAAELNGYPGPSHVLELADKLELTPDQRRRIKALFDAMKAEAVPLGSKLIEQEADLEAIRQPHRNTGEFESINRSTGRNARRTSRNSPQTSSIDSGSA